VCGIVFMHKHTRPCLLISCCVCVRTRRDAGVMSELIDDYHFPILLVSDSIGIFVSGKGREIER